MIHVLDYQSEKILTTLENKPNAALFWNDTHEDTLKNNQETFDFTMQATVPAAESVSKRNLIVIPDEDGFFREFIILETYQYDRKKEVKCNASFVDIAKQKIVDPIVLEGQTIQTAANHILSGTDWQLGIAEGLNLRKVEFTEHIDALSALRQIASLFELEIRFRVETKANRISGRYVDFIEREGMYRGKEIVLGKDLIGVKRHENSDVVTALIGLGPEREDGTRLIVRVQDEDALQRWSKVRPDGTVRHLWGIYKPETSDLEMTEARLTELTRTELNKRINTSVQYEADAVSIEHILGYEHEKVRKGDTVRIKDTSYVPPLYLDARIISVKRAVSNRSKKTFILGDFIEYTEEEIMATFKALKAVLAKKASVAVVEGVKEYAEQVAETAEGNAKEYAEAVAIELSEVEKLKGHKVLLANEKAIVDEKYNAANNHPQLYDDTAQIELTAAKNNYNSKYTALGSEIDTIVADKIISDEERLALEIKTNEYRSALSRFEAAYTDVQESINNGKAADAEKAATDFVEEYANKKISQGTISPSNPVPGDLWIDTSSHPHVWKRWAGTAWVKATTDSFGELKGQISADQIASNIIVTGMISTDGLDAAVIKFGTMSGDRILANSMDGNRIKARTLVADAIFGGSLTVSAANLFSFADPGHNSAFKSKIVDVPYISPKSFEAGTAASQPKNLDIQPGETFTVSFYAKRKDGATNSSIRASFRFGDAAGTHVKTDNFVFDGVFIGSWKRFSATMTAPPDAYKMNVYFTQVAGDGTATYVNAIMLNRGAIALEYSPHTDDDINAGAITGDKIRAGTVDANVLKAGTVIANNIKFTGELSGATGTFSGRLDSAQIQITNPDFASDGFVKLVFDRMDIDPVNSGYRRTGFLDVISQFNQLIIKGRTGYGDTSFGSQAGLRIEGNLEVIGGPFKVEGLTTLNGAVDVTGRQQITVGGDAQRIMGNASAYTSYWKDYGGKRIGYVGPPTSANDNLYVYSDNGIVQLYGSCKINTMGSIARWQRNDNDYISQSTTGQIVFYMGGAAKHAFNPDGSKSGGSIDIDGENLGMSPIDSPQVLIEYIDFAMPLDPLGTKVFLDDRYRKAVANFSVFPNNGKVIEKGFDYYVIAGEGVADCRIIGERVEYEQAFWADMSFLEVDIGGTVEEAASAN